MHQAKQKLLVAGFSALLALCVSACAPDTIGGSPKNAAAVDQNRLNAADKDHANWMSYGRTYSEQRFSPLKEISAANVGQLELAWYHELDTNRGQEATPLVIDGVLYTSTAWSKIVALNAMTGEELWAYDPKVPGAKAVHACCDVVNRGVAAWNGKIISATLDGRLIAIDAKTGKLVWSTNTLIDDTSPYTITGAPRVANGKVFIGNGGAELGVRGYVSAFDAETGKLAWRFFTVPGDPAKGPDNAASDEIFNKLARSTWFGAYWKYKTGGTVWDSIVYDPELNQLYIGVGNGSPWNHQIRSAGKGDNLFLGSIVALNPDTGAYIWHYQANPGETWDFGNNQQIMLATLPIKGKKQKVLMQAPKNGFYYVINRETGQLLSAEPYVAVNWAERIDLETGRPIEKPGARFLDGPFMASPSALGAHAWHPMSFNPGTGLVYIPTQEVPLVYSQPKEFDYIPGRWNTGVNFMAPPPGPGQPEDAAERMRLLRSKAKGHLLAWDPIKQKEVWRVQYDRPWNGGTLSTAGNLVFAGDQKGFFNAFSAETGQQLWRFQARSGIIAGPISYQVNGEQYIAVMSGHGGSVGMATPPRGRATIPPNGLILAFKIKGGAKLPDYQPVYAPPANPPAENFTKAQVALGEAKYQRFCAICHRGSILPDLRRSAVLTNNEAWQGIVIGGDLTDRGMVSFKDNLSSVDAEAIRAYIADQAVKLKQQEEKSGVPSK